MSRFNKRSSITKNEKQFSSYGLFLSLLFTLLFMLSPTEANALSTKITFADCNWTNTQTVTDAGNKGLAGMTAYRIQTEYVPNGRCRAGRFYTYVGNYINTGTAMSPDSDKFGIAFYIKWAGSRAANNYIVSKEDLYEIYIDTTGMMQVIFNGDSAPVAIAAVPPNAFLHYAFTVDGDEVKVYKNGTEIKSFHTTSAATANGNNTFIGQKYDGSQRFGGNIDEFEFFYAGLDSGGVAASFAASNACNCCPSPIKIVGDYIEVSDTYNLGISGFDHKDYLGGFTFSEAPLLFILPDNLGGHSAYIRASDVDENGFNLANIEPQGEDGPHIAMHLNYIAVNQGLHELGEYPLETCTVMVSKVQWHNNKGNAAGSASWQDVNPANLGWQQLNLTKSYANPVVFASIISRNNELRPTGEAYSRELSRPWMTVAIKHQAGKIYIALDRSETTFGAITQPEEVAYMVTEANVQSWFLDDSDTNISYETILTGAKFRGTDVASNASQQFTFVNTYGVKPLVMANTNSRNNPDGGWFRRNSLNTVRMQASIWEDRKGAYGGESKYLGPNKPGLVHPIGVSPNQDKERKVSAAQAEVGALIAFDNIFTYAAVFTQKTGLYDAVEEDELPSTKLETKIANKPFVASLWHLDELKNQKPINIPVKVEVIATNDVFNILEVNTTTYKTPAQYAVFTLASATTKITLNVPEAKRQARIKITYGVEGNGSAVDFTSCFSGGGCPASLVGAACTATCNANPMGIPCAKCYYESGKGRTHNAIALSTDRFAVRPDKYVVSYPNPASLVSGKNYHMVITALDGTNVPTIDYNGSRTLISKKGGFVFDVDNTIATKLGCASSDIKTVLKDFANGTFDTNASYPDVGKALAIQVREKKNGEYAVVDRGNTDPSFDSDDVTRLITVGDLSARTFITSHFDIDGVFRNHNTEKFTYMSDVDKTDYNKTSSDFIALITSYNELNAVTQNFSNACYAIDLDNTLKFTYSTKTDEQMTFRDENDTTVDASLGVALAHGATTVNQIIPILKTQFANGSANIRYGFNINRVKNRAVNPIKMSITKTTTTDHSGVYGYAIDTTSLVPNEASYVYGRVHAPRVRVMCNAGSCDGSLTVYYEIFADKDANRTIIEDIVGANPIRSIDSVNWYMNTEHNTSSDGNISATTSNIKSGIDPVYTQNASTTSIKYNYTGTRGYPYKGTVVTAGAPRWLVYDKYNAAATEIQAQLEFYGPGKWSSTTGANSSIKKNEATQRTKHRNTNRRIKW